jgi:hypothetical protein
MFAPDWEAGCKSCSFSPDNYDGIVTHLSQRDVALVVVSRARISQIEAFKKRMGWSFKGVSSFGSDFNHDYQVSFTPEELATGPIYYNYTWQKATAPERPGTSVFYQDENATMVHTTWGLARPQAAGFLASRRFGCMRAAFCGYPRRTVHRATTFARSGISSSFPRMGPLGGRRSTTLRNGGSITPVRPARSARARAAPSTLRPQPSGRKRGSNVGSKRALIGAVATGHVSAIAAQEMRAADLTS